MSNWSETQLTAKGRALDAKVTAGLTTLTFTRMKIGSGNVTPEEIDTMTDLKSPRLVIGISSCEVSEADPTICSVIGVATSDDVETSFLVKEQGLFATDPDDGEILYAVMLDSEPDKMPNQDVPSPLSIMYQINVVSDNASSITAVIDPAGLVTVQTMTAAINTHNSDATAHSALITAHNNDATAHGAAINSHNTNASAHKTLYGVFLRQPDTDYALGNVVYLPCLGTRYRLECVSPGRSANSDLTVSTPTLGATVSDGTVTWKIMYSGDLTREITPAYNTRDILTTSGTYIAPVTGWYKITCIGGGGAGGSNGNRGGQGGGTTSFGGYCSAIGGGGGNGGPRYVYSSGSGGGAAGRVAYAYVHLDENDTVSYSIGAGGVISTVDNTAPTGDGISSYFNPAGATAPLIPAPGARGAGAGTFGRLDGGYSYESTGGCGGTNGTGYGGGGGGSCGSSTATTSSPGAGGDNGESGVYYTTTGVIQQDGGAGGDGAVIVEYFATT